ncbi:WAP four-disulfide core domain protein 5 [Macaca fascicularis]|uniref:WAP four-disulfide core domain protein 5 n=1 Tax=Macaca fascicularis TaxID=9541 RepID=UPI0032B081D3
MRIQSLLLLGALLAVGSQLPAVFGRKKGEKWGGCPADDGPCLLSVPDQCVEDSQCPLTRKCCYRACFRQCVPRVSVKPGSCPQDQLRCLSPMNHLCHKDSDCSGKKRCCHSACGRDCRDPARGVAPGCPGQVPSLSEPQL